MFDFQVTPPSSAAGRVIPFPIHRIVRVAERDERPCRVYLAHTALEAWDSVEPVHVHHHRDEVHVVLEGRLSYFRDNTVATAGPGETVVLPRGVAHAIWNGDDAPVRLLTFVSQDTAFRQFFSRLGAEAVATGADDAGEWLAQFATRAELSLVLDAETSTPRSA